MLDRDEDRWEPALVARALGPNGKVELRAAVGLLQRLLLVPLLLLLGLRPRARLLLGPVLSQGELRVHLVRGHVATTRCIRLSRRVWATRRSR